MNVLKFFGTAGMCRTGRRWLRKRPKSSPAELLASCRDGEWLAWSAHALGIEMGLQVQFAMLVYERAAKLLQDHPDKRTGVYRNAYRHLVDAADWSINAKTPDDALMAVYAAFGAIELAFGANAHSVELVRSADDARRIMGPAMLARCAELGVGV